MMPLRNLGRQGLNFLRFIGGISILTGRTFVQIFSRPFELKNIITQIEYIGVRSLGITCLTAVFTGMVSAVQFAWGLSRFGAKLYVGKLVALGFVRELGPVLTALMVGGRVGSGITAEIGSMVVTEQIDAMRALGSNPVKKLVLPRLLALMISMPLLTFITDVVGVTGGMVITIFEVGITPAFYYDQVITIVNINDIFHGVIKSIFFGYFIGIIGCYKGLLTTGGTEGVGRSTTSTVVVICITILISDYILTELLMI